MNNPEATKSLKAIFFDWDNTLVDTWPTILNASNVVFEHFGLPQATLEEVKIRAQHSARDSFPKLFGERYKEALAIFYQAIESDKDSVRLYDGVHLALESLRKSGYAIAIISNKKGDLLREEIELLKIQSDLIIGSGDAPHDKPHPEMGLVALKHFGLQANQAVYIGDSITDWLFAKNLNMAAIAIGNDAYDGELLARFDAVTELAESLLQQRSF